MYKHWDELTDEEKSIKICLKIIVGLYRLGDLDSEYLGLLGLDGYRYAHEDDVRAKVVDILFDLLTGIERR